MGEKPIRIFATDFHGTNQTMTNITAVDRLEVLVVVDNVTDSLSTNPNNVQT